MRNHLIVAPLVLAVTAGSMRADETDANAWRAAIEAGKAAFARKHLDGAEAAFKQAVTIAEKLGPMDTRLAASLDHLATVYASKQRFAEAEPMYLRALGILEKNFDKYHPDLFQTLQNLATLQRAMGKLDEAEQHYRRILKILQAEFGDESEKAATGLNNLAALEGMRGKFDKAAELLKQALAIRTKALGEDHPAVAATHKDLGNTYLRLSKTVEAIAHYQRSLDIIKGRTPLSPEHVDALAKLATAYEANKQFDKAVALHEEAAKIYEVKRGEEHASVAEAVYRKANALAAAGKLDEAEAAYKDALAIQEKTLGESHVDTGKTLFSLGRLYVERGKFHEAEPLCKRAVSIFQSTVGPRHPYYAVAVLNYAAVLENTGRQEAATRLKLLVERLQKQADQQQP